MLKFIHILRIIGNTCIPLTGIAFFIFKIDKKLTHYVEKLSKLLYNIPE